MNTSIPNKTENLMKDTTSTSISMEDETTFGSDLTLCNDLLDQSILESSPLQPTKSTKTITERADETEKPRAPLQTKASVTSLLQEIDGELQEVRLQSVTIEK